MCGLVALSINVRRKEGLSAEEFHKYWSEDHASIFRSAPIAREKIVKYVQLHASPAHTAEATVKLARWNIKFSEFDGIAILYAKTAQDIFDLLNDATYMRDVLPDESVFVDRSRSEFIIGYEEDQWVKPDSEN